MKIRAPHGNSRERAYNKRKFILLCPHVKHKPRAKPEKRSETCPDMKGCIGHCAICARYERHVREICRI